MECNHHVGKLTVRLKVDLIIFVLFAKSKEIISFAAYLIVILTIFPCWTIHVNTESLLISIGQDPEVSK